MLTHGEYDSPTAKPVFVLFPFIFLERQSNGGGRRLLSHPPIACLGRRRKPITENQSPQLNSFEPESSPERDQNQKEIPVGREKGQESEGRDAGGQDGAGGGRLLRALLDAVRLHLLAASLRHVSAGRLPARPVAGDILLDGLRELGVQPDHLRAFLEGTAKSVQASSLGIRAENVETQLIQCVWRKEPASRSCFWQRSVLVSAVASGHSAAICLLACHLYRSVVVWSFYFCK